MPHHPSQSFLSGTGSLIVKTAPASVRAVASHDASSHGLDEAPADRQAETCPGPHLIAFSGAIELVEDPSRDPLSGCRRLRPAPAGRWTAPPPRPGRGSSSAGGAYLAALSSRLKSTCSNSTGSIANHRQVGGEAELDPVMRARTLRARWSAAPRTSLRSLSAMFGSMAPDSRRVMSSRLAMKRFSRSASSCTVASRSSFESSSRFAGISFSTFPPHR